MMYPWSANLFMQFTQYMSGSKLHTELLLIDMEIWTASSPSCYRIFGKLDRMKLLIESIASEAASQG